MAEELTDQAWKKDGTEWGLKCGLVAALLVFGAYFINKELLFARWILIGVNAVFLFGVYQVQQKIEALELKPYIQPGFLVFVIGSAVFYLSYHVLFAYVDPDLVVQQVAFINADGTTLEPVSVADLRPSIRNTFDYYARSLMVGFVLAAITGLVFKYQRGGK